ncbi:hypothetical protein NH44784_037811 [Achromobacter xylosoxidans NH44784-1996]|nr:hypothetical protein NH44784_037811 [Achromobacter xylosoxidans NH44784-1996]
MKFDRHDAKDGTDSAIIFKEIEAFCGDAQALALRSLGIPFGFHKPVTFQIVDVGQPVLVLKVEVKMGDQRVKARPVRISRGECIQNHFLYGAVEFHRWWRIYVRWLDCSRCSYCLYSTVPMFIDSLRLFETHKSSATPGVGLDRPVGSSPARPRGLGWLLGLFREKDVPMVGQVLFLVLIELPYVHIWVNAPGDEHFSNLAAGNQDLPLIGKRYPGRVEQLIDVRREKQAIVAVETLLVRALTPRPDVARDEQIHIADTRYAAGAFHRHDVLSIRTLPYTRQVDPFNLGLIGARHSYHLAINVREGVVVRHADQVEQLQAQRYAKRGQVSHVSAAILAQWRMDSGKKVADFIPVLLRGQGRSKRLPLDFHAPSSIVPRVIRLAGSTCLLRISKRDANSLELRLCVGKDDVSPSHAGHVGPGFSCSAAFLGLGTPDIAAAELSAMHLIVAHPPVAGRRIRRKGVRGHVIEQSLQSFQNCFDVGVHSQADPRPFVPCMGPGGAPRQLRQLFYECFGFVFALIGCPGHRFRIDREFGLISRGDSIMIKGDFSLRRSVGANAYVALPSRQRPIHFLQAFHRGAIDGVIQIDLLVEQCVVLSAIVVGPTQRIALTIVSAYPRLRRRSVSWVGSMMRDLLFLRWLWSVPSYCVENVSQPLNCPLRGFVHPDQGIAIVFECLRIDLAMMGQRIANQGVQLPHHVGKAQHVASRILISQLIHRQLRGELRHQSDAVYIEMLFALSHVVNGFQRSEFVQSLFYRQPTVAGYFNCDLYWPPELVLVIPPLNAHRYPGACNDRQGTQDRLDPRCHRGMVALEEGPDGRPTHDEKCEDRQDPKKRDRRDRNFESCQTSRATQVARIGNFYRSLRQHRAVWFRGCCEMYRASTGRIALSPRSWRWSGRATAPFGRCPPTRVRVTYDRL